MAAANRGGGLGTAISHSAVTTSKTSLACMAMSMASGSKGVVPGTRSGMDFGMRNRNGLINVSGKERSSRASCRTGDEGTFTKGMLTVMRSAGGTKDFAMATDTGNLRASSIAMAAASMRRSAAKRGTVDCCRVSGGCCMGANGVPRLPDAIGTICASKDRGRVPMA